MAVPLTRSSIQPPEQDSQENLTKRPTRIPVPPWCLNRLALFAAPRNWSRTEWHHELRQIADIAAWEASSNWHGCGGDTVENCICRQVMNRARQRYREEVRYSIHFPISLDTPASAADANGQYLSSALRFNVNNGVDPVNDLLRELSELVAALPAADQAIIRGLFWEERSEKDLAEQMGIPRRVLNKRKHAIEQALAVQMLTA